MPLAERIAIVTGANRGIRLEVVRHLAMIFLPTSESYWLRFK